MGGLNNMEDKRILDIKEGIKWVGVLDPGLVTFDVVMETKYGTTYNSYFIDADKKTIIETSKETFKEEYLNKVKSVVDPKELEYVVLDHTEPDHSSNLKHLLEIAPNVTVVGTKSAINFMKNMVDEDFKYLIVKGGDTLDLGNKTLRFISAPFLHWPDSMYTYLEEDRVLFTCDSFGAHYCDSRMFDDSVDEEKYSDSFKYYFDVILKPFSKYMIEAIDRIRDLDIDIICPGHGPVLRDNWQKYVGLSYDWSKEKMKELEKHKVFIPYVSAYGNTEKIAKKIGEGLKEAGNIDVDLADIEHMDIGEMEGRVEDSSAIIIGCPTVNQNILLPVYKLFAVINPMTNRGKLAAAFGSYGWSGEGIKLIEDHLKNLKLKIAQKGLREAFVPYEEANKNAIEFGKSFGEKLLEK